MGGLGLEQRKSEDCVLSVMEHFKGTLKGTKLITGCLQEK